MSPGQKVTGSHPAVRLAVDNTSRDPGRIRHNKRWRLFKKNARLPAVMVGHLAVGLVAWVVPERLICVARANLPALARAE